MSQFFQIHPETPQARLIHQAAQIVRQGGLLIYPTDSCYALACRIGDKSALERIRRLRRLSDKHNLTLACSDLSQLGLFARIDTAAFRLLKNNLPGPYTFILAATREVPRILQHPKRRTIGLRIPGNPIARALLAELGEPMFSTSLILPDEPLPLADPFEIRQMLEHQVDLIIDGGYGNTEVSTVVDLSESHPSVLRIGCGDPTPFSDD